MNFINGCYSSLGDDGLIGDRLHKMNDGIKRFEFDQNRMMVHKNMACGANLQWITEEDHLDQQPLMSEGLIVLADVILDNRVELIKELGLESSSTDCQIILGGYRKWSRAVVNHLIGDYAFVIYDVEVDEVFMARDHVGKRTMFYHLTSSGLAFSSAIMGLLPVVETWDVNEQWLHEFMTIPSMRSSVSELETCYEDVERIKPGHYGVYKNHKIKQYQYWNPLKVPPVRHDSHAAYVNAYNAVLDQAVQCRLRTNGQVGISLSGGLDSSAIACVAAKSNPSREIHGYTATPLDSYVCDVDNRMVHEGDLVDLMTQQYKNIKSIHIQCQERNAYNMIPTMFELLKSPYKYVRNSYWYYSIPEVAATDGCKILLDGQYGNISISAGYAIDYIYDQIRSLRFDKVIKYSNKYCRHHKVRRKHYYKQLTKMVLKDRKSEKVTPMYKIIGTKRQRLTTKHRMTLAGFYSGRFISYNRFKKYALHTTILDQAAEIEVLLGYEHKLCRRDPSRDYRVIEYCMNIPQEHLCFGGQDRELLKEAMAGIVPSKILDNTLRGLQSADWKYRMKDSYEEIGQRLQQLDENILPFMLKDRLLYGNIDKNELFGDSVHDSEWTRIIVLLVIQEFINAKEERT